MNTEIDLETILFLDTESNPETKQPECITWLYGNEKGIIREFNEETYKQMKTLWDNCESVLMFQAPYDMGVLSIMFQENSYTWEIKNTKSEKGNDEDTKSAYWKMVLFGNTYQVRRINGHRNLIKAYHEDTKGKAHIKTPQATPVIDLLKLWSILVNDGKYDETNKGKHKGIGLKALIHNELHCDVIPYSVENAKSDAYCYQDVEKLKELTKVFFIKIQDIKEVNVLSLFEWSKIVTPASFVKMLYERHYGKEEIKQYQLINNAYRDELTLKIALEEAFHGGITLSMYRGEIKEGFWFDIKGAYSKAIEVLNTDKYLNHTIEEINKENINFSEPYLLYVKANFIMKSINGSLKLFYVTDMHKTYIWNYDIIACNNLIDDFKYEIIKAYKITSCIDVASSLPEVWNNAKNEEKKLNGKTTLYEFYKFLSNTSYGIKAQRKPFITIHTNMVIAGMITAKVHQILTTIIKTTREHKFNNLYNDTDSCFCEGKYSDKVFKAVSIAIAPFEIEYEGSYQFNKFLSLKRYVSTNGKIGDKKVPDKIKLHGKGRYSVSQKEILEFCLTQKINKDEPLNISQFSANTETGIKMIINIFPQLNEYKHPFMFVKDVKSTIMKSEFMKDWYEHIDTKTSIEENKKNEPEKSFYRHFHRFLDMEYANVFFDEHVKKESKKLSKYDDSCNSVKNWDSQIEEDFSLDM